MVWFWASVQDASLSPPWRGVPGTSIWEETPWPTQERLVGLHLLGMPGDSPIRAGVAMIPIQIGSGVRDGMDWQINEKYKKLVFCNLATVVT